MAAAWGVNMLSRGAIQVRFTVGPQENTAGTEKQAHITESELSVRRFRRRLLTCGHWNRSRPVPGHLGEPQLHGFISQHKITFRSSPKPFLPTHQSSPANPPPFAHHSFQRLSSDLPSSAQSLPARRRATIAQAVPGGSSVLPNGLGRTNGAFLAQGGHEVPSSSDKDERMEADSHDGGNGAHQPVGAVSEFLSSEDIEPEDRKRDANTLEGFSAVVRNNKYYKEGREGGSDNPAPLDHQMLAAVDLGTNSFHMVVVRADSQGRFQIEDVEKEDVRLGSGSAGFSVITPEAEERAVAAIKRLKKIAQNRRAEMRVVATSAVREARNRRAFIRRIHEVTGVEVEVLTGREEACLIYTGILQAMPVFSKTVLTVDIGGGSTEFVLGKAGKPLFATSLKLGHIRLTERFAGSEPLTRAQVEEMRRFIRVALVDSGVLEVVHNTEFEVAIGSSGTIETLEQMIHHSHGGMGAAPGAEGNGNPKVSPGFQKKEFTREELSAMVKKICKAKTAEARAKIPGLPEKRADVILGGSILLEEIFLAMGVEKMQVSSYALREGVIVDTLSRKFQAYYPTPNLRRSSVLNLANKFNVDRRMESALHSAELALEILSGLQTCRTGNRDCMSDAVQRLEESDVEVLEAATILHYVGMFISHKGYHKHSHYLIKNNEHLLGFTPMEIEMIALLARYHRKKVPSNKDEDFEKLPEEVQKRLRALCAVIRIAVALDRCDSGSVATVHTLQDHNSVVLAVSPAIDTQTGTIKDVSLEVWAARAELEYFEKVFKRKASIVVADQPDMETLDEDASVMLSS